jgi:TPR repeat protein
MPGSRLLASTLAGTILAASPAAAQSGWHLESLLRDSGELGAARSIMSETGVQSRYAIVIGNADYSAIPKLANARADAQVVADFLRDQGYDVHHYEDVTKRDFENVLRRALFDLDETSKVVLFFAGHGFQIGAENYLVPVDADLDSIHDVPFEAVSLGSLVNIVGARARVQVVILDSCRDNPFAGKSVLTQVGNELRETRTGFSSQAAPLNSMLVFSTSPGSVAFDGEGEHSPFTAALIDRATEAPDAYVKDVFEGVRRTVWEKTNGRQVPWESSTLVEPVSFGLSAAAFRPAGMSVAGGGMSRGLARVVPVQAEAATPEGEPAFATLDVPFEDAVEIGPALAEALGLAPADEVAIVEEPSVGRLVRPDETGPPRNVLGAALLGGDIAALTLLNRSVQTPARTLEDGLLRDSLTVEVNGDRRRIDLRLRPNPCDFEAGDHLDPDGMGITRFNNEIRPDAALAACEAAIAEAPEVGRFHYQLGRALIALRRTDEARTAFERARDLGHARAWNAIGNGILNEARRTGGQTDDRAPQEALRHYARGVEAGDPYAFYSLGRQFLRYGETSEMELEGYDLMMRSLEVGHTFAMNELGFFYLDPDSEYHDPERGLRYLRESAAREDIYGFNNMGLVYLDGLGGVERDDATAYEFFLKAAEGGHPDAPQNLGNMLRDGRVGGGPDYPAAVAWYVRGLERGDGIAGGNAAYLVATQSIPGYAPHDAAVLAAKVAALRDERAVQGARQILAALPAGTLDAGAQALIRDLGGAVEVDGAFGAGSQSALNEVLARRGAGPAEEDPVERIVQLARLHWQESPFRVDLY